MKIRLLRLWVTGHTMAVFSFFSIASFKYIEWTNVNWTTATHMHARSPNAYLHRSGSLLRWVIGPHIGFKSSQVIKRTHNSGGVECVHAVEMKVKPACRTSLLRSAFLCATQVWRKNEDMLLWVIDHSLHVSCHQQRVSGFSRFWPVTHDYVHRRVLSCNEKWERICCCVSVL